MLLFSDAARASFQERRIKIYRNKNEHSKCEEDGGDLHVCLYLSRASICARIWSMDVKGPTYTNCSTPF